MIPRKKQLGEKKNENRIASFWNPIKILGILQWQNKEERMSRGRRDLEKKFGREGKKLRGRVRNRLRRRNSLEEREKKRKFGKVVPVVVK